MKTREFYDILDEVDYDINLDIFTNMLIAARNYEVDWEDYDIEDLCTDQLWENVHD